MSQDALNRRRFLRRTSTQAAVVGAAAAWPARALGANERLSIGIIGAGDRGSALMTQVANQAKAQNVEISAVCDVWQVNLNRAAERVEKTFGRRPRTCTRFADLLSLKDVDAVVIATPDFTHCPILIEAIKAGKDAYVEKPMSISIEDANQALDLARAGKRIVQAGTQYRSHGGYRAAARELAAGAIGQINRVHAAANFNHPRWARPYNDCKPSDVDWEAFLLNRPTRSFDPRLIRRWHLYREFTNGLSGLWMSHYVDAVHLVTGAKYPRAAAALGNVYVWKDGREHTDTFHALLDYPEGFLFDWGMGLANSAGTEFFVFGTDGTLDIGKDYATPSALTLSSDGAANNKKTEPRKIQPDATADHMGNWLECLRSRRPPNADIQFGHQHAVATIMAATALETGRRQKYDPQKREMYAG